MKTTFKAYNGIIRLYLRKKQLLIDDIDKQTDQEQKDKLVQQLSLINQFIKSYFKKGELELKKQLANLRDKFILTELGDLYANVDITDQAATYYKDALALDSNYIGALNGLGSIFLENKNYRQAIKYFQRSLRSDADDLLIKTKLAEANLKSDNLHQARIFYEEVLERSPYYIDALLGLSECFTSIGEKNILDKDNDEVEGFFNKAEKNYNRLLEINKEWSSAYPKASRPISREEEFKIKYSRAYLKVKLFQINKNYSDLHHAKKIFKEIRAASYMISYKADNAYKKVERVLDEKGLKNTTNSWLVFWLAIFIFICSVFLYVIGKPDFHKKYFVIDREELGLLLSQSKSDSINNNVYALARQKFQTENTLSNQIIKMIPPGTGIDEKMIKNLVRTESEFGFNGFVPVNEWAFGSMLFGSLVFIVVGLYLRDLTKLKLGSIELEKTVVQSSNDSANLASKDGGLVINRPM